MLRFYMAYVPVRLDDRLARELDDIAEREGRTRSEVMRSLLRSGLASHRQEAERVTPPTDARSTRPRTK